MSTNSKRIKVNSDILLEYVYDTTNNVSEDYKILTNIKDSTKSFQSTSNNNSVDNSLFMVDSVLNKYTNVDTNLFNFLKLQNYSTSIVPYDKVIIYLPSGFDFYDYLGFYINIYSHGYDNNDKYSLTNFYYTKDNIDNLKLFDLNKPFLYDEKFWVRGIEIEIPSPDHISKQRLVTNILNEPTENSINKNLTNGEGLSINSPIFIDFSFIISSELVLDTPYYYVNEPFSFTLPSSPEFTELGVDVVESTNGDYFEIYSSYMGSNENMDEFIYNEQTKGNNIQLEYVVTLFEENILVSSQTYRVIVNFTQKILYRPVIQYSNTTAAIDVELKIINMVDGSYHSKFGSIGLTTSLNKYGTRLSKLNISDNVISPEIYNVKRNNTTSLGIGGNSDGTIDIMRIPYPVLIDKYNVMALSQNTATTSGDYAPNGLLEIILTSFDTILNFTIAKNINSKGNPIPYNLTEITNNSKIVLSFKSDSEKIEKEIYYDANNNYEIGNIFFKVEENDYNSIKKIYDKGYDNFYILVKTTSSNTQLYSGKYIFYEDVEFTEDTNINQTVSIVENSTDDENLTTTDEIENTNPTGAVYFNVMIYVRFTENIELFDNWLSSNNITPKIKYANVYFLDRIDGNILSEIEKLEYLEQVFRLPLSTGQSPSIIKRDNYNTTNVHKDSTTTTIIDNYSLLNKNKN